MNIDQLKENLTTYVAMVTEKSGGANMYICPLCGSGTGHHKTGAFSIKDRTTWKCFSCNEGGDIFDLVGKIEGLSEYQDKLNRVRELFGVTKKQHTHKCIHISAYTIDHTDFFLKAHRNIGNTDYPQRRGLSEEIVNRFNLGYDESWRHPNTPNAPATPRLIIPTSNESYLARDTRENIPDTQKPYAKSKVGKIHLFNAEALAKSTKPVFAVEGELDALSVMEVGGEAVALGSTTKAKALIELLKVRKPAKHLIISLDNDDAGEKATNELISGLEELHIPFYRFNIAGEHKDASEALQHDREAFKTAVMNAENVEQELEQARREAYLRTAAAHKIDDFVNGIVESVDTPYIQTGFSRLDAVLDGGLYEGLYIVGAISSLGKTTLMTQIADQIAQNEHDVLIFSLEMASYEIMAKSISRHTAQEALKIYGNTVNAKTTRGITTGKRYENYSTAEKDLINSSIKRYGAYANHIFITEGIGNVGIDHIRQTIRDHTLYTGKVPVVIIDYLQILTPYNERATDKQNTDKAVMELKRISRDYKIPVVGISSFNRANYSVAVAMEAFKESGAIEYSSDVLIGLQFKGAGQKDFDPNNAKKKNPREVELVILKNRNGATGCVVSMKYYPLFNFFEEE